MSRNPSRHEAWKENNPDLYDSLIQGILRLKRHKFPHAEDVDLDTWDDFLFLALSRSYMEKRVRQQIIRGLLNDAEEEEYVEPPSFYDKWKEMFPDLYNEIKEGIQRLNSNKVPHLDPDEITLDWWDDHVFLILTRDQYLEKRHRQQIINRLLSELEITD